VLRPCGIISITCIRPCALRSHIMPNEEPGNPKASGRRGGPVSLAPLSMDEAVDAIFQIKPADVKKVIASKQGKGTKSDK
jgi:hypothetical protein